MEEDGQCTIFVCKFGCLFWKMDKGSENKQAEMLSK